MQIWLTRPRGWSVQTLRPNRKSDIIRRSKNNLPLLEKLPSAILLYSANIRPNVSRLDTTRTLILVTGGINEFYGYARVHHSPMFPPFQVMHRSLLSLPSSLIMSPAAIYHQPDDFVSAKWKLLPPDF